MADYELNDIDPDDISDLLIKIEKSFDIKFGHTELIYISTFGELCDHVINKIQLDHSDDCTSQQAFYKLREAIVSTLQIDKEIITTDFSLAHILPKKNRHSLTKKIEDELGFKLNILRPPYWVTVTLFILLLASFIGLFFIWKIGLTTLLFSIAALRFANKFGNELDLETVGQVAGKMTRENYLKSRRTPKSFNRKEIEKILTDLFSNDLYLDKNELTREAKFV
ncbi:hypothetical protein [Gynurincola endophyticus]|uniref:hypothetical protein n=1 Tax=Gynurincola endophyticus TaxID=2479004 RepID=UPI000F8C6142|nr:hypothetical protein [Gynurincola endophyticus]